MWPLGLVSRGSGEALDPVLCASFRSYTLTESKDEWVPHPAKKGDRAYLDYCTRHPQLEKRLKLCK